VNQNKPYWEIFIAALAAALLILFFMLFITSCKILHKKDVQKSDTADVKKETQTSVKVDTSKSKSESAYTRETFIYPGRDTNVFITNNYPASPAVYIRESGTKKTEDDNFKFEDLRKEILDSLKIVNSAKQTETKIKTDWMTIAILAALGLLIAKNFIGPYISLTKK